MERKFMGYSLVWDFSKDVKIILGDKVVGKRRLKRPSIRSAVKVINEIQDEMIRDALAMEIC